jgi:hypothetical protein
MTPLIGDIVGEIVCGNSVLDAYSTYDDFLDWLDETYDQLEFGEVDKTDYPQFSLYNNHPEVYWPYVEKFLKE